MRAVLLLSALLLTAGLALAVVPASSAEGSEPCGGVVDVGCDGASCQAYQLGPLPPECVWSEPAYCTLYVNPRPADPVCVGS